MASRRELTQSLAERYAKSTRNEKQQILEQLTQVTGFHRKDAIRVTDSGSQCLIQVDALAKMASRIHLRLA